MDFADFLPPPTRASTDCFHGSSTGNIHFHGTHANPKTTGDNIFVEVRPSLRKGGQPVVTEASVRPYFDEFFKNCETQLMQLDKSQLSQWPYTWDDLPSGWINSQIELLRAYDSDPAIKSKLLPVDEEQRKKGAWPQYYIGAYPYCFHLPVLATPPSRQTARPPTHPTAMMAMPADIGRTLQMGQAPGTHWYHAHKHGSTTRAAAVQMEADRAGWRAVPGQQLPEQKQSQSRHRSRQPRRPAGAGSAQPQTASSISRDNTSCTATSWRTRIAA